jgi:hypothetical protein
MQGLVKENKGLSIGPSWFYNNKKADETFLEPMKIKYYFLLIFIFSLFACARANPKIVPSANESGVYFEAQVVDPSCVLKGDLVIEPFKSGEGVLADAEVSSASLNMVKGFVDVMKEYPSPLNVIIDDKTDKAVFFIKGYVTSYENPAGMINHVTKKCNIFAVEGKIVHLETNRVVVRFSSRVESFKEKSLSDFAYRIGKRLASYLLGQDQELP